MDPHDVQGGRSMFRDMTLGRFYPSDSVLHRLDPRVKLYGTVVFAVSLFFPRSIAGLLAATIFLGAVISLSRVPVRLYIQGIRPLLAIIIFSALMNMLFTPGEMFFRFGPVTITREGLFLAAFLVIRLLYLIVGSTVMTFTTTPGQLTAGLEKSLAFLSVFHIPVHEFAMMMSIALRFIPILTEELDKIMKAQMSRGADFEKGNLIIRAKKLIPVLLPLFVAALRRASDLAMAMEARCYHGGKGRTRLYPLVYGKADFFAYAVLLIYLIIMAVTAFVIRV